MSPWHIWTVAANRQKRILKFLSELDFIDDFLYPMAEKRYSTKKGDKIKNIPIYANYIFIKYEHNPITSQSIERCPWISTYVGICSEDEMRSVKEQNKKDYDDLISVEQLEIGSVVKLIKTPFAGWDASIVDIDGDKLFVSITILGADRTIKCSTDDVNIK